MNLRDPEKYRDAAWDYSIFNDCFPGTKIRPCDVDFIVERNGHFLVIEFKPEYATLTTGQRIMLKNLSRVPNFTVILVLGTPPDLPIAYLVFPDYDKPIAVDKEGLCAIVRFWFEKANA